MKRAVKIFLFMTAGLLLFACLAAWIAPRFIQTDLFKRNLETFLSQRTGRDIRISGNLVVHFVPWVGFKVADVQIAGGSGPDNGPMATCKKADIRLEFVPLLEKRIVFKGVYFDNASLRLIRHGDGTTNWQDLLTLFRNMGKTSDGRKPEPARRFVLDRIGSVRIRRSTLTYLDETRNISATFSNLELDRQGIIHREFRLAGELSLHGPPLGGFERMQGHWEIAGNSYLDTRKTRLAVTGSKFTFPFKLMDQNGQTLMGKINARLTGDTARQTLSLSQAALRMGNATAQGALHVEKLFQAPSVSGQMHAVTQDLAELARQLNLANSETADWIPSSQASLSLTGKASQGKMTLEKLAVQMGETRFSGRLAMEKGAGGQISGRLKTDFIDLDRLFSQESASDGPDHAPFWRDLQNGGWTLDLDLSTDRIRAAGQELERFQSHVAMGDGKAVFRPASVTFAGGEVRGGMDAVLADEAVSVQATIDFNDISLPLLWPGEPGEVKVNGRVDGRMDLISEGAGWPDLADAISGTVRIEAPDGVVIASGQGDGEDALRLDRAVVVLAAYGHGENSTGAGEARSYSLDLEADGHDPKIQGRLKSRGIFRLTEDTRSLSVTAKQFNARFKGAGLGTLAPVALNGSGLFDSRTGRLVLDNLSFQGLGLTGTGRVAANARQLAAGVTGHVTVNNFDPMRLAARLGLTLPRCRDPLVFQHAHGDADFNWDRKNLRLEQAVAVVDDTRLQGRLSLGGAKYSKIDFEIHGDRLDLDRYLPPDGGSVSPAIVSKTGKNKEPGGGIRGMALHGRLTFDRLKTAQIWLKDPDLDLDMGNGILTLVLQKATLYGGRAAGDAVVDLAARPVKGSALLSVDHITLTGLLEDLFGWVPITGTGAMKLSLAGGGTDLDGWVRSLNGMAWVTIDQGAIQGVRMVPSRGQGQEAATAADPGPKQEPFEKITGTVFIENGVLKNTDAQLSAASVRATGAGSLDLSTQMLDYAMTADIRGLPMVDYTFIGPLDDIAVNFDRMGFARETAKGILKSPFRLGKGTLNIGTQILGAGQEAIGDRTGPQRMGQGALGVGKGILDLGKGVFSLDGEAGETLGNGAKEVGQGLLDVGRGALDTGQGVLEGIGGGIKKIFSGGSKEKENGPTSAPSMGNEDAAGD